MTQNEIEAKFYIQNLSAVEKKLRAMGAELHIPRVHEINLRFDTPDHSLTSQRRVLRLRQDSEAVLTYKGPSDRSQEVSVREEIEVRVSSFDTTRKILEALGYELSVMYEKERTTYLFLNTTVTLDEMPYGTFIEIEGPDADTIHKVAQVLGLNWEARCAESYLMLFDQLRSRKQLKAANLSFADFQGLQISAEDLGLRPADQA